jgi:glycosyltransferase involved in cell wall biosynthesis
MTRVLLDLSDLQAHSNDAVRLRRRVERAAELSARGEVRGLVRIDMEGATWLRARLRDLGWTHAFEHVNLAGIDERMRPLAAAHFIASRCIDAVETSSASGADARALWAETCALAGVAWSADGELQGAAAPRSGLSAPGRPSLALIAPYPPARSGIADYAADLTPHLMEAYDCVLVVEDSAVRDHPSFPGAVIGRSQFMNRRELHARVLYHVGNSQHHKIAFDLMRDIPGVVMAHDFFLADAMRAYDAAVNGPSPEQKLAREHGASALFAHLSGAAGSRGGDFPMSLAFLGSSASLLCHSEFVRALAREHYGEPFAATCGVVPFYKPARGRASAERRRELRARYGFSPEEFLVASFGFAVPAKRYDAIIQAFADSSLARPARLLLVGEYLHESYRKTIDTWLRLIPNVAGVERIGYVPPDVYRDYIDLVDAAVQLRVQSRGETSAALLDCLAAGVPTIVNAHGSARELPEDVVWRVSESADPAEISAALETLQRFPIERERLSRAASAHVLNEHSAEKAIAAYVDAIECAAAYGAPQLESRIIARHVETQARSGPVDDAFLDSLHTNAPRFGAPRIYVDVTALVRTDLKTGIQRVVRSLLLHLLASPPAGFVVDPIYIDDALIYRKAFVFAGTLASSGAVDLSDEVVEPRFGDVYLGLDLHADTSVRLQGTYRAWRNTGVRIVNVVYDLLPLEMPHRFPDFVHDVFRAWAKGVAQTSDAVLAISQTVARSFAGFARELAAAGEAGEDPPARMGWFHLGSDLEASAPTRGLPDGFETRVEELAARPLFLMVSTVEPRKGHALALEAFDLLWTRGVDASLVIVGKQGWLVEDVARAIRGHREFGRRLHWFEGLSDEGLDKLYGCARALVAASEGEGFGLPLIEAARHGSQVIARDIPVFREIGADGVSYFDGSSAAGLADFIESWLKMPQQDLPDPSRVRTQTWADAAEQAIDVALDRPHANWIA